VNVSTLTEASGDILSDTSEDASTALEGVTAVFEEDVFASLEERDRIFSGELGGDGTAEAVLT
jgi:hypothetical protein